ncbi:c2 domain-containing protein [Ditylenchus destructor]|uniref:C2 domain-containing protein n=1 Tax=Ditylenchus destructor TaxID=166010 RepID=A0AAD4N5G2_9BILA|nr:c2 domain-containing protein [Ditylenchus destructor]
MPLFTSKMRYSLPEWDHQSVMVYVISGTVLLLFVIVVMFLVQQRRSRLNWYEQNLLEIATSPPNYVRCKALPRLDTDDDRDGPLEPSPMRQQIARKQSRIHEVNRHSFEINMLPTGEFPFTVPKMLKSTNSMFKSLDQSQIDRGLYQTTMDSESCYDDESIGCCGSIKLGIFMDPNLNLLTVTLKQAMDLVAKRQDGYPNPYFKVSLDVPDSPFPKIVQSSKIYKDTASPSVIGEEYFFQIPNGNVNQCRLEVMVYDFDQFSVDECIGYCWLTLGRLSISTVKAQPTIFWAEVMPFDDDNGHGFGEVLFSLTYLSKAQRLTVNVFKARNLRTENVDNMSSNAIRITLMTNSEKRLKRKKTSSKKNTKNPQFNESLTFGIPKNSLCDTILEIEAIHEYGTFGMGCKVLGRMELPLHKCRDLWRAIIREEKSQARWYTLEEP